MACKITYKNNEIKTVLAPNNKESILFDNILQLPEIDGKKEVAIRKWAEVYLDDFKETFGDWEASPEVFKDKLDENGEPLIEYINIIPSNTKKTLKDLKTGTKNILEVKERESKKNIFIDSISEQDISEDEGFNIQDLTHFDERLASVYSKLQDNLDHQVQVLKKFDTEDGKNPAKDRIVDIADQLNKYEAGNQIKGVLYYVKNIGSEIDMLQKALNNRIEEKSDAVQLLERYKRYLSLFSAINDVNKLFKDVQQFKEFPEYENTYSVINDRIKKIKSTHDNIEAQFVSITREYMADNLNDIKYHPHIEKEWRDRLGKEYDNLYGKANKGSKKNWVNKKLLEYKPQMMRDIKKSTKELIYNKAFDITYFAENFLTSFDINSDIVQIFQTELSELRDSIIQELTPVDKDIAKMHEEFKKEKGSYNPEKQFKNIREQDRDGNFYLKGEYKLEFMHKQRELQALYDDLGNIDKESQPKLYKEALVEINTLKKELYVVKNNKVKSIKVKWKNNLSNLSDAEKKSLNMFKQLSHQSSDNTMGINALVRSVGYIKGTYFYKFPSITKSDAERMYGQGVAGITGVVKDKFTDLTKEKVDDIGFETEKASAAGQILRDVPIHFRGILEPSNQSMDLFTMYKMEAQNSISFKHRKNKEMFLEMLIDIAKNKEYYTTKGLSFTPLLNRFAKRNRDLATDGNENTKIVKKLRGIMDTNMYDITKKYQGKLFGKYDVQKMVGFINGYTGMLGMSLNYHSALVNLTGGYSQFLIHAISNDVISTKNLKKAMARYYKELGSRISDINSPDNKSFINQLNIMFDSFGGQKIGTESFLKDKAWKKFSNTHGLAALHTMGEHQMQSVISMAVLDSVGALDSENNPLNKDGKELSLLDMLSLDDNNVLKMDDKVVYTTHTPLTKWNDGGRVQTQMLLKYKIFQTSGVYDDNLQPEIMKTVQGRLGLMFRRFFIPLALNRFRGTMSALKDENSLQRHEKFFSHANKRYEEGSYVTTARFIWNTVIPALKAWKLEILTEGLDGMSDYQKSNIKKATVEMAMGVLLSILSGLIAQAADDDDDELLYFLAYVMRRTESELKQFRSLEESYRITKTPFASLRTIENVTGLLETVVSPSMWGETYKTGKNAGDLKVLHKAKKMTPVWTKFTGTTNKELYGYMESKGGF